MSQTIPSANRTTVSRWRPEWLLRLALAVIAFSAQGVHLANLSEPQRVWWGYGVFFLIVAVMQGVLAVSLLFDRPTKRIALAGAIGNGLVALVWGITRIGGIPGLITFEALPVGDQGLAATIFELTLVVALIGYLVRGSAPRAR